MCGIAGYVARRRDDDALRRMTEALAHRGPDGSGHEHFERDGWHIGLGHRRLAIIDRAAGRQPFASPDGRQWMSYNGEVYNFADLAARYTAAGETFRTRCDTEIVLRHLRELTDAHLRDLDGMFALAVWDQSAGTLLLARDRVGIKPLYYANLADGGLVFASELTALMNGPERFRELDANALAWYLFADYVPAPGSILRGVRKLQPGHSLTWQDGRVSDPRPFWTVPVRTDTLADADAAVRSIGQRIDTAVHAQMVADVPLGVFLSGGIDSSAVAASAAPHAAGRLKTFAIGFENPDYDESAYAQQVADRIGAEHHTWTLDEATLLKQLDPALACIDEPLADPSILPTHLVSQFARRHVTVCLGGDGGDELFGGYPTLKAHRLAGLYGRLPRVLRQRVLRPLIDHLPDSGRRHGTAWKAKRFVDRFEPDALPRHLRWMSTLDADELPGAMPAFAGLSPTARELFIEQGDDAINNVLLADFRTYLPGSVLAKVDRASMAHSLEVRPPLLGNAVIDLAFALPGSLKFRGGRTKWAFKHAMTGRLPASIIDRPKRGFGIPIAQWMRGPLASRVKTLVHDSAVWDLGLLDRGTFVGWFEQHLGGRHDRSKVLWSLLVLDDWVRRTI